MYILLFPQVLCIAYNIKKSVLNVYVGKKEALYNSFGINQGEGIFFERK
jgi:hypothetical protein